MDKKKKIILIWISIIVIVLIIASIFYLLSSKTLIPSAKFPQQIEEYTLRSQNNESDRCGNITGTKVCVQRSRLEYVSSNNSAIHIVPMKVTGEKQKFINQIKEGLLEGNISGFPGVYRGKEPWELYWFSNKEYEVIGIQQYQYTTDQRGDTHSSPQTVTISNPVIQWLLKRFPPTA